MKYRVLSLIIPALLMGKFANALEIYDNNNIKVDLYGRWNLLHSFSPTRHGNYDWSAITFGINSKQILCKSLLDHNISTYGRLEISSPLSKVEDIKSSELAIGYAGLDFGNLGSIDYGRNYGVIYDIGRWTAVLPKFFGTLHYDDNFMFRRANGLITYRNKNGVGIKGLEFALQYQFSSNPKSILKGYELDAFHQNGYGLGMSTTYQSDSGLSLGIAMFHSKRTSDQNGFNKSTMHILGRGGRAIAYSAAIKYDANNFYIGALYSRTFNATHFGVINGNTSNSGYNFSNNYIKNQYPYEEIIKEEEEERKFLNHILDDDIKRQHEDEKRKKEEEKRRREDNGIDFDINEDIDDQQLNTNTKNVNKIPKLTTVYDNPFYTCNDPSLPKDKCAVNNHVKKKKHKKAEMKDPLKNSSTVFPPNLVRDLTGSNPYEYAYGYADIADNVELVAQYKLPCGINPSIMLISSRGEFPIYGTKTFKKYLILGFTYYLNEDFITYVDYQVNFLKNDEFAHLTGIPNRHNLMLGITYRF